MNSCTRLFFGLLVFLPFLIFAQVPVSPFNQLAVNQAQPDSGYSFLVGGHLYGSAENQNSVFPSPSLLANLDRINATGALLFVALGDIIRKPDYRQIDCFVESFASPLRMPLFNAVGNHDVLSDRRLYTDAFGPTYYDFKIATECYIILDTVLDYTRISGEQLRFFTRVLSEAEQDPAVRNIFIFSHNPIWSEANPDELVRTYPDMTNYAREIYPVLSRLAGKKKIFWVSDDIGGDPEPLSFFFYEDTLTNITYLATGIGNTAHDALIKITIGSDSRVTFRPMSLTGAAVLPLEYYGVEHWRKYVGQAHQPGVPEKILRRFKNSHFRQGTMAGGLAGLFCLAFIILFYRNRSGVKK